MKSCMKAGMTFRSCICSLPSTSLGCGADNEIWLTLCLYGVGLLLFLYSLCVCVAIGSSLPGPALSAVVPGVSVVPRLLT